MQLKFRSKRHFKSRRKIESIVNGTSYGEIEESNRRATNVIVGHNKGRKGFVKNKLGVRGCRILGLEKKKKQMIWKLNL